MLIFAVNIKTMPKAYKFTSDKEPTDEQLQMLMNEVAIAVKIKSQKANELFWAHLQQMVQAIKVNRLTINPD